MKERYEKKKHTGFKFSRRGRLGCVSDCLVVAGVQVGGCPRHCFLSWSTSCQWCEGVPPSCGCIRGAVKGLKSRLNDGLNRRLGFFRVLGPMFCVGGGHLSSESSSFLFRTRSLVVIYLVKVKK
jgi:hypothetical protein